MKNAIIRGVLIFAAGAGCASVVGAAFLTPPPITPPQFQERVFAVLAELESLGYYVGSFQDGQVGIFTDDASCIPKPPRPKMPAGAVNPVLLARGVGAVNAIESGLFAGETELVFEIATCRPVRGK